MCDETLLVPAFDWPLFGVMLLTIMLFVVATYYLWSAWKNPQKMDD